VIVRGVACRITWPTRKSSKNLPGLFFDIADRFHRLNIMVGVS
jgi:hypothetical protein